MKLVFFLNIAFSCSILRIVILPDELKQRVSVFSFEQSIWGDSVGTVALFSLINGRSFGLNTSAYCRQLIDCIRGKDTDALLAAVSSGAVDVNFTDDVGQTLLNWAAAFGTKEMVEFLCEKGWFD